MPLVSIIVFRTEVEAGDTSSVLHILKSCLSPPERALFLFESVDIAFHGYDDDARELFEIPDVREFVHLLDSEFPYWLFFLNKSGLGLQCLMLSFMPPYLTDEAKKVVFPERLEHLLSRRWFPAMNQICEIVGFSEQQVERLTDHIAEYFIDGPLREARS
jgi:hypothetical protein